MALDDVVALPRDEAAAQTVVAMLKQRFGDRCQTGR